MEILNTLIGIVVIALGLWLVWNILEVVYRLIVIVGCVIAIAVLTVWDWIVTVVEWTVIKPVRGVIGLIRHLRNRKQMV